MTMMYPGLDLCDGERREDRTQPGEGCWGPLQWAREQGEEHGLNVPGYWIVSERGLLDQEDELKILWNEHVNLFVP